MHGTYYHKILTNFHANVILAQREQIRCLLKYVSGCLQFCPFSRWITCSFVFLVWLHQCSWRCVSGSLAFLFEHWKQQRLLPVMMAWCSISRQCSAWCKRWTDPWVCSVWLGNFFHHFFSFYITRKSLDLFLSEISKSSLVCQKSSCPTCSVSQAVIRMSIWQRALWGWPEWSGGQEARCTLQSQCPSCRRNQSQPPSLGFAQLG